MYQPKYLTIYRFKIITMPCTLCGTDGHNRRTCQRWDMLEAVRHDETAKDTIMAHNAPEYQSIRSQETVTRIFQTLADIATDISTTPTTPTTPTRRTIPHTPSTPRHTRINRDILDDSFDSFDSFDSTTEIDFDGFDFDIDPLASWDDLARLDELLNDIPHTPSDTPPHTPRTVAQPTQLVDCVKHPCESTDCPICMEDFQGTDLFVTRCGHQFHGTCMIRHMKLHDNCPMCRGVLFTSTNI